jgi:UDPglucose--hexose-1-phosphate uridylyltransferase
VRDLQLDPAFDRGNYTIDIDSAELVPPGSPPLGRPQVADLSGEATHHIQSQSIRLTHPRSLTWHVGITATDGTMSPNDPAADSSTLQQLPHRRRNALTGEWVLVSPHRTKRPWQGQQEAPQLERRPAYDPECYLCPGNARAGGLRNPVYTSTFVFQNDFSALLDEPGPPSKDDDLFRAEPVRGECRVICFSPRHDLTLAEMDAAGRRAVVELWCDQSAELHRGWRWVQIFENKGAAMGCSNPHPHGQIWASDSLPNEPAKEDTMQRAHMERTGALLLMEYAAREAAGGERVVVANERWIAVVPFWAVWPYETILMPRFPVGRLEHLADGDRDALTDILGGLLPRYDNLFKTSFPYSMGWHGAPGPGDGVAAPWWQLHAHFYPPLLRSATVRKFLVGYEMLAEAQRDITPEQAAAALRAQSAVHYRQSAGEAG